MKISVITVVRNNKGFVEDCVKSVIAQTYKDLEYILIDGASTDGTFETVNKYIDRVSRVISEKDGGYTYAMNKGLSMASGEIIGFLHSDDFYADDRALEKVAGSFALHNTDSLYADLIYVKKEDTGKIVRYWRGREYDAGSLRRGWMPAHPTFFVKKNIYEKYGYFDTNFRIAADYENMLKLLHRHKISSHYLPAAIVKMRWGGLSNKSAKNIVIKTCEDYRACRMHGLGLATVIAKNVIKLPQLWRR